MLFKTSRYEEILKAVFFLFLFVLLSCSSRLCIGTCFCSQLCITVCQAALWSYFTVRGYVLFNPSRLKTVFCLVFWRTSSEPTSETHFAITGTFTLLILEQGQTRGTNSCTLSGWCLVDKLKLRLYTVQPDSTWHLTAFTLHSQEYLSSSSFSFKFLSNQ